MCRCLRDLKHWLTTVLILAILDYNLLFLLDTNASGSGIGAVLSQAYRMKKSK